MAESIETAERLFIEDFDTWGMTGYYLYSKLLRSGVSGHIGTGGAYPLRSTMAAVQVLLDPAKFVRVHRSHIVNLDYLLEIEPLDTGDARLKLRDGTLVSCSRTYRGDLRGRIW
jgi:LytTr DNA-binding domain